MRQQEILDFLYETLLPVIFKMNTRAHQRRGLSFSSRVGGKKIEATKTVSLSLLLKSQVGILKI